MSNDQHFAANHRGDDPDTIGSFPCECEKTARDADTLKKVLLDIATPGTKMEDWDRLFKALRSK